jgi:alpha-glucosidase
LLTVVPVTWAATISSPSGEIKLKVGTAGGLTYGVEAYGKLLLLPSALTLTFKDHPPLGGSIEIVDRATSSHDSTWEPVVAGRCSAIRDRYNEMLLKLKETEEPGRVFALRVRVYDNGVAFRYEFPKQPAMQRFVLVKEATRFRFAKDATCWAADYGGFISHQEKYFQKTSLKHINLNGFVGLPLLVRVEEDIYLAITEAALVDYAGMYLRRDDTSVGLVTRLAHLKDDQDIISTDLPHNSPWRVMMVARRPVKLLENDMILNLNEPCAIKDTSWIRPGMMAWDHWWSGEVKMDTATIKEYIQLASDMGWPYQLIDWQWYGPFNKPHSDITKVHPAVDMDEVLRFAREKGVKPWLWLYWADVHRNEAYLKAFALYEKWGIGGVKIDFMQRDDQWMVNWYHKIVKKAAEHRLMVNFHGAYKPTGWRRTYPNLVTREGVLANEYNKFKPEISIGPDHKCTLAFTRNLLGEMDFTPGGFLNRTRETFRMGSPTHVLGTRCQELALFVIYESPLTCLADHPKHYRNQVGADFLKMVPTTWDETLGIDGAVGEYITVAKRKGGQWFVGTMANWDPCELTVPLGFLGGGWYRATVWRDADDADRNAENLVKEIKTVTAKDSLQLRLAPGGGAVVHLVRMAGSAK